MMKNNRLIRANIALMVCAMACLVCYDIFGGLWLKGVTSSWFVMLGGVNLWAARKLEWKQLRFFVMMAAGLLCDLAADVLLGINFLVGVGVFALGHVFYVVAFFMLEKPGFRDLWFILPIMAVSMFVVVGTPWITVEDPFMRKMLLGYAVIISLMLGKAISNLIRKPSAFRWMVVIGGFLFWFSDIVLTVDLFGQSSRLTWILCSYSYWPAQTLLAHSLLHRLKECE